MLTSHPVHLFPKETLPTEPKKGAPAPRLRELDPPDLRFPTPWRRSSLRHSSSPHPLLPCQRLLFLPAFSILVSGTTILSVTNSAAAQEKFLGRPLLCWPWFLGPRLGAVKPSLPLGPGEKPVPAAIRSQPLSSLICFLPRILPSEFSSFQKMATTGKHRPQGPSWSGPAPFTGTFVLPFLCTPCSLLDPLHFAGHAPRSPAEMPRTLRHWDRSPPTLVGSSALGTALPPYQSPTGLAPGWRGTPARVSPSHKMAVGLSKP